MEAIVFEASTIMFSTGKIQIKTSGLKKHFKIPKMSFFLVCLKSEIGVNTRKVFKRQKLKFFSAGSAFVCLFEECQCFRLSLQQLFSRFLEKF